MQDLLSPTSRQRHIQLSTIVLHICPQIGPQCRCYSSQSGGPAKAHLCSLATLKVVSVVIVSQIASWSPLPSSNADHWICSCGCLQDSFRYHWLNSKRHADCAFRAGHNVILNVQHLDLKVVYNNQELLKNYSQVTMLHPRSVGTSTSMGILQYLLWPMVWLCMIMLTSSITLILFWCQDCPCCKWWWGVDSSFWCW